MYSLSVNTHMKPIIITMNKDEEYQNIISNDDYKWIKDNAFLLDCNDDKMFHDEDEPVSQHDADRAASWPA